VIPAILISIAELLSEITLHFAGHYANCD